MITLWIAFVALVIVALGFILWPLVRKDVAYVAGLNEASVEVVARARLNTSIYQERLQELKLEYQQGKIDKTQYDALELDQQKTLLADIPPHLTGIGAGSENASSPSFSESKVSLVVIALVITIIFIVSVFSFYWFVVKDPHSAEWIALQEKMEPILNESLYGLSVLDERVSGGGAASSESLQYSYADYIRTLQFHLQSHQTNTRGWVLLGKAYQAVELPQYALEAFERAGELSPQNADVMLGMAGTKIYLAQGRLDDESRRLIDSVLQIDPMNINALMLKGMASFSSGLYQDAIDAWDGLLKREDGTAETEQSRKGKVALKKSIAFAREKLASTQLLAQKAVETVRSEERFTKIKVSIDITPDLKSKLNSSDTLFVYAQAVSGPRMPIAVVKQAVTVFPIEVTLDDTSAMIDKMKLSNFSQVNLAARISETGQAIAQAGDFQAPAILVTARDVNVRDTKANVENSHTELKSITLKIDSVL